MASLYELMHLPTTATDEQIRKRYNVLFHEYSRSRDGRRLADLNSAKSILLDPYQRAFYDTFGENAIQPLLSNELGYFYPRLFTHLNICCVFVFVVLNAVNLVGYFYFFCFFELYLARNMLFVLGPVPLAVVHANISCSIKRHRGKLVCLVYGFVQSYLFSTEVAVASLCLDGVIPNVLGAGSVLVCEMLSFVCFVRRNRLATANLGQERGAPPDGEDNRRYMLVRIFKCALCMLYFVPGFGYKAFIPLAVCAVFSVLVLRFKFYVEGAVLPYTCLVHFKSRPNWVAHLLLLMYALAALYVLRYAVLHFVRYFDTPVSMFDGSGFPMLPARSQSSGAACAVPSGARRGGLVHSSPKPRNSPRKPRHGGAPGTEGDRAAA